MFGIDIPVRPAVPAAMMIEKTPHSIFLPELVLPDLLPNDFPPWRHDTELESVAWIAKSLRRYFAASNCRGCIVNAKNQLLHQHELDDARQLSLWACAVLERATRSVVTRSRLFIDVCVPVLHNTRVPGRRGLAQELFAQFGRRL